jgi:hypothetical protein
LRLLVNSSLHIRKQGLFRLMAWMRASLSANKGGDMKRFLRTEPGMATIVMTAIALAFTSPANAGPIQMGTWLEFGFGIAGVPATGCDPADPSGPFCIESSGTPTSFLDAPPWTFQAPLQGAVLVVTDAFLAGDRFQIFDFGVSRGLTSLPSGSADCGDDPVPCLATAGISKGSFIFASGNHSISITPTLAPGGGGSAYLRVDAVPEPSTWILLGGGLAAIWLCRRSLWRIAERGLIK